MAKEMPIKIKGTIVETLPSAQFSVEIEGGHKVLCHISGKIRMNKNVTLLVGDVVEVEVSPYDWTKGRIVWRVTK